MIYRLFVVFLTAVLCLGCGGQRKVKGEIVGVEARISFEEAQDGSIEDMAYGGALEIMLPDSTEVYAQCPKNLLASVKDCPERLIETVPSAATVAMACCDKVSQVFLITHRSITGIN